MIIPYLMEKPVIYMFNVDENELKDEDLKRSLAESVAPSRSVFVNAKLEAEMSGMTPEERKRVLQEYGIEEDALGELVKAAYETLGLQKFFLQRARKKCELGRLSKVRRHQKRLERFIRTFSGVLLQRK